MDLIALLMGLFTQWSVGLPLLLLLLVLLVWVLAAPRIRPPVFAPRPVQRPMPPDIVSNNYWALATGRWSGPLGLLYLKFVAALRARYGVAPWQVPWRDSRARKLGITDRHDLIKLDEAILKLYNEAIEFESRAGDSILGPAYWERRQAAHRRRLERTLVQVGARLPEIWGM